jgi:hypothetical protein
MQPWPGPLCSVRLRAEVRCGQKRKSSRPKARTALGLRAQSRPPGTEFLDAETRGQKWSFKRANARRDQKPRIEWPEIPAENALFGVLSETFGLQGLGGGGSWAQTGDPPPSHRTNLRLTPGTEISDAETGVKHRPFAWKRPILETDQACEMPPFQRNKCD